jgi:hypothetical protein
MSIYHLEVSIISRGKGKSAVAAAAYRSGEKITNEYDGITHDFTKKRGIISSEIIAPKNAPSWVLERQNLWNKIEKYEKRCDARLGREIVVALPVDLSREKQQEITRQFVTQNCVNLDMIADVSFHDKDDGNPHAHILLTDRRIGVNGIEPKKDRTWNERALVERWREAWEVTVNNVLEREGAVERVSCRSLAERGINRKAQIHVGPKVARGYEKRKLRNEAIKEYNAIHAKMKIIKAEEVELENQIEAERQRQIETERDQRRVKIPKLEIGQKISYKAPGATKPLVGKIKSLDDDSITVMVKSNLCEMPLIIRRDMGIIDIVLPDQQGPPSKPERQRERNRGGVER